MQIGAVKEHVRKTIALNGLFAEIEELPLLTRAPQANLFTGCETAELTDLILQSQFIENPGAVRTYLDTSAHLLNTACLLIDINIEASSEQRERCCKPPQPSSHDCNLLFCH